MNNTMKISIISVVVLTGLAVVFLPFKMKAKEKVVQQVKEVSLSEDTLITLVAVGDIMMGSNFPSSNYLPREGVELLKPMHEFLQMADVTFGNLEGTILNEGGRLKKCSDSTKCYAFRQPEYFVPQLKNAGFDFLSVANNHMGDFGEEGRTNTQRVLKEAGIRFAGLESCPWDTLTVKGVKIGMTAFAPNTACLQITDFTTLKKVVGHLDSICDIVIVSFHGGAEGKDYQHIPCTDEIYLGYNRGNACEFAHAVVDAGADIVFGHGPHVTRAMELYNDRLICYSLGNFCTYARFNLAGPNGLAPIVRANVSVSGEFLGGEIIPVYQAGEGGPRPDPQGRVITRMKELLEADFPDGMLDVDDKGIIRIK